MKQTGIRDLALDDWIGRRYRRPLSDGERNRLDVMRALTEPQKSLCLLDTPLSGLSEEGKITFMDAVIETFNNIHSEPKTLIFSTLPQENIHTSNIDFVLDLNLIKTEIIAGIVQRTVELKQQRYSSL
ncbi:hypothetical protein CI610_01774 [invertebrate metagenome]|uniref:Uncharacterized protein n=1 Tax=invertebrate metagenome TaxID=1711999 RepID=A0A2H9T7Q2_9ZZZZ